MKHFALLFLMVVGAWGDTFFAGDPRAPITNSMPWLNAGIAGGIPTGITNAVNLVTDYSADNTGVADCTTPMNNALAACPAGSAIFMPAGTYKFNSQITVARASVVIRGAGSALTIIKPTHGSSQAFKFYLGGGISTNLLSSGYTRGSTNLTLATTTGVVVGKYGRLQESNNPALAFGNIAHEFDHGQVVKVLSLSGNDITIDSPIYLDFTAAYQPFFWAIPAMVTNSAMESLTIDLTSSTAAEGIRFERAANCWLLDVTVTNISGIGVTFQSAKNCSITRCRSGWVKSEVSSTYAYQLAQQSSENLIFDCIGEKTSTDFIVQVGACANVVAYNYSGRTFVTGNCFNSSFRVHGDIPYYNLFEGNIGGMGELDNTWGSNPLNTYNRNWFLGEPILTNWPTDCRKGFFIQNQDYTNTWIGNIIQVPADRSVTPTSSHIPWSIDADSAPTLFMHGNFNFMTNAVQWSNSITHTLPSSFYLSSKPTWFYNLSWPPIGPDISTCTNDVLTNTYLIPAQARYYGFDYTSPPPQFSAGAIRAGRVSKP